MLKNIEIDNQKVASSVSLKLFMVVSHSPSNNCANNYYGPSNGLRAITVFSDKVVFFASDSKHGWLTACYSCCSLFILWLNFYCFLSSVILSTIK
jgi:hypothetical protein